MVYYVIDTETSGLPVGRCRATESNINLWDTARVLSIAIVEYDDDHVEVGHYYKLIKHDNVQVASTHVHGIDQDMIDSTGIKFSDVYSHLSSLVGVDVCLMGHNLEFDLNILKSEMYRYGFDVSILDSFKLICTLKMARSIFVGTTSCKLGDLHKMLLGSELDGAHNALNDCRGCARVYTCLLKDPRKYKDIGVKRIVIGASNVAAAIGKHPYKKANELIDDLWKKYKPSTFDKQSKEDIELESIALSHIAQAVLAQSKWEKPSNSKEVQELYEKAKVSMEADRVLTRAQRAAALNHIRSTIYTSHGTRNEDATAIQDASELYVDDTYYQHPICTIKGTEYVIVGRIDRYECLPDGTHRLVEIKNRSNKLFNTVRMYENIQVQTYLHMINLETARLLEQYNTDTKSHLIMRDRDFWDGTVDPSLKEFCKTLHHFISAAS